MHLYRQSLRQPLGLDDASPGDITSQDGVVNKVQVQ